MRCPDLAVLTCFFAIPPLPPCNELLWVLAVVTGQTLYRHTHTGYNTGKANYKSEWSGLVTSCTWAEEVNKFIFFLSSEIWSWPLLVPGKTLLLIHSPKVLRGMLNISAAALMLILSSITAFIALLMLVCVHTL